MLLTHKMFLRLRFTDCRSEIEHYADENRVTNYGQLREEIAQFVDKRLTFHLSHNYTKDHIHVDDATTLKDLGLVNWDVLTVVICPDQSGTKGLYTPSNSSIDSITLCRESKPGEIPTTLEQLYQSQKVETMFDAVVLVIHRLMREVGFFEAEVDIFQPLIHNWRVMKDVYKMKYCDPDNMSTCCQLFCVVLGENILMVTAVLTVGPSRDAIINISLCCDKYVNNSFFTLEPRKVFMNLPHLSQCFKDSIALPLMNIMRRDAGLPTKSDFMSLPAEMKLLILNYLDGPCLIKLSQVCTELNQLCNDNTVWKKCYMRDMPRSANAVIETSTTNWKKQYLQLELRREHYRDYPRPFYINEMSASGLLPECNYLIPDPEVLDEWGGIMRECGHRFLF